MAIRDIVEARIQELKQQREAVVQFFKSCKKREVVLDSLSVDFNDFFKNKTREQVVEKYTNMTKNIKVSEGAYWVFDCIEYANNSGEVLIVLKRPETDEEYNKRTGAIDKEYSDINMYDGFKAWFSYMIANKSFQGILYCECL